MLSVFVLFAHGPSVVNRCWLEFALVPDFRNAAFFRAVDESSGHVDELRSAFAKLCVELIVMLIIVSSCCVLGEPTAVFSSLSAKLGIPLNVEALDSVQFPTVSATAMKGVFKDSLPLGVRNGREGRLSLALLEGHLGCKRVMSRSVAKALEALAVTDPSAHRAVSLTNGTAVGKTWTALSVLRVCWPWDVPLGLLADRVCLCAL